MKLYGEYLYQIERIAVDALVVHGRLGEGDVDDLAVHRADHHVALVVEQTQSGNYQGQTILTLDQAYIDARLLCRLNSEWLTTNISADEADEAEDSAE